MAIDYTIKDDQGNVGKVSTTDLVNQLHQRGYPVQGLSPDGTQIHMHDDEGPYTANAHDVLKDLGWEVSKAEPQNASYDHIDPKLRAAVTTMPEHLKKPLLEAEMKQRGIENPVIVGAGRNWFIHHPNSNQYIALTNDPNHWGMGDAAEAGIEGSRAITSAMGGAGGFALGGGTPASVALAAGGSALGGSVMDAGTRALLSAHDPAYQHMTEENAGDIGWDMAGRAGMDALGGAVAQGMGPAARGLVEEMGPGLARSVASGATSLAEQGPASRVAQGVGKVAHGGGELVGDAAHFLRRPGPSVLANAGDFTGMTGWNGIPISGDIENLGYLAQAPEWAAQAATKGLGSGGEALAARGGMVGKLGEKMRGAAQRLTADRPGLGIQAAAEENWMAGSKPHNLDSRTIFGNALQGMSRTVSNAARYPGKTAERRALMNAYKEARKFGIPAHQAHGIGKEAAADVVSNRGAIGRGLEGISNAAAAAAPAAGRAGEMIGAGVKRAAQVGRGAQQVGQGMYQTGMGAAEMGGRAAQGAGHVLEGLGDAAAPLENQLYLHFGTEEGLRDPWDRSNPWRRAQGGGTIDPTTLAQN